MAGFPLESRDTPMILPGMSRLNLSSVAATGTVPLSLALLITDSKSNSEPSVSGYWNKNPVTSLESNFIWDKFSTRTSIPSGSALHTKSLLLLQQWLHPEAMHWLFPVQLNHKP
ncbi:hypothetical protein BpHYR1_005234 [Brachionus plicatilis]|uniref:Uncharacterized protein n=1 Tax=Brachionus plicatilis TaxID=10195 RepID=A0A3M7SAS1_BRAPC|nr:hypothetical protein BpHYR1_005234 [Brachionus plicatilis]